MTAAVHVELIACRSCGTSSQTTAVPAALIHAKGCTPDVWLYAGTDGTYDPVRRVTDAPRP